MKDGKPTGVYEYFMTGFVLDKDTVWGRLTGIAVAQDGASLVSDDANGTIFRLPLILMLLTLIFRGVAFEMRFRVDTQRTARSGISPSRGAAMSPPSARASRSARSSRVSASRIAPMQEAGGTGSPYSAC